MTTKVIENAADLLHQYAAFIRDEVKADDLERHPYAPEIDQTIDDLRALTVEASQTRQGELASALEGIVEHATSRIQDGHDMGPRVWRIALEDIVRDAKAALSAGRAK